MQRILDSNLFESDYVKMISNWCKDYYDEYKKAPGKHIQDIYEIKKTKLLAPVQENIEHFLSDLSNNYETYQPNISYLQTQTKTYFETRKLESLVEKSQNLLSLGKIEQAKEVLRDFKTIAIESSETFNPLDAKEIRLYRSNYDSNNLFRFQGAAGKFFDDFKRSWLISFMGPEKRGKSHILLELMFQAAQSKLKVLFISLEMSEHDMKERIYQRLTAAPQKTINKLQIPVMDCKKNQKGICERSERKNKI